MKLFLDQDVYAITVRFLIESGHDVVCAADLGLAQAEDMELLRIAGGQGRIFVTRDRDFGGLVFVLNLGSGVIYLRMTPFDIQAVHQELGRVLGIYSEHQLHRAFIVIEPARHRFRRLPRPTG
jgi:predicted nuclease of predicted toxin-antitoxin system